MAPHWISALTARQIVAENVGLRLAESLICKRAHAGLVTARAQLIQHQGKDERNRPVPKGFWWAEGHEALEQDWVAGDFSTWIDRKHEIKAFGVEFDLSGIVQLLPLERRGTVMASFSVAGNSEWVSANNAVGMIAPHEMRPSRRAENQLIEAARLGFVAARAVEALASPYGFDSWQWNEREWDIEAWFWEKYTGHETSSRSFEQNSMRGMANGPIGQYMQINGLHFWRADLERHFMLTAEPSEIVDSSASDEGAAAKLPRLAESKLQTWWETKATIGQGLTLDELWTLARAAFPDNHVARDRIRELGGGRKPGPKPISGNPSAK